MKAFLPVILFIFGIFPLLADEEMDYLIKTMSWTAIDAKLKGKSNFKESEVYALYRMYAGSTKNSKAEKLKYLVANIRGKLAEEYSPAHLQEILSSEVSYQSVYVKLSIWYLYKNLENDRSVSYRDKIKLLEKIRPALDPVYKLAVTAILKHHSETKNWGALTQALAKIPAEYKVYIWNDEIGLYEARAWRGEGHKKESFVKYTELLRHSPSYICSAIVYDWQKEYGSQFIHILPLESVLLSVPCLGKKDRQSMNRYYALSSQIFSDPDQFRQAGRLLAEFSPGQVNPFVERHHGIDKIEFNTVKIAEDLYQFGHFHYVLPLLTKIKSYHFPDFYRISYRIALKNRDTAAFSKAMINYLNLEPYDSYAYDTLVEKLISLKGGSARKYWETAMDTLPNLPQKGRLVYWYLRYLRDEAANKTELSQELKEYYKYCPGSYYTDVIYEEFNRDLTRFNSNLTANDLDSLNQYLSSNGANPAKIIHISNSSGYLKESRQLAASLSDSSGVIRSESILQLAAEYTSLGEYSMGRSLVDYYFEVKNLNDLKKYEVLVGLGDFTKTYFLSVYYTRMLLRAYRIPDDPVLLPYTITSRLFPRPHREIVQKNATKFNIDEDIIYAIMRQESQFRESAVSSSNAQGLMQVMPATGKYIAKRLGIESYSLFDPEISIQLGAKFLSDLLSYTHEMKWASIAYNGGPGNLSKWKRKYYKNDFNHFLEKLPSKESRDYCRIILTNLHGYKVIRHFYNH